MGLPKKRWGSASLRIFEEIFFRREEAVKVKNHSNLVKLTGYSLGRFLWGVAAHWLATVIQADSQARR